MVYSYYALTFKQTNIPYWWICVYIYVYIILPPLYPPFRYIQQLIQRDLRWFKPILYKWILMGIYLEILWVLNDSQHFLIYCHHGWMLTSDSHHVLIILYYTFSNVNLRFPLQDTIWLFNIAMENHHL